MQTISSCRPDWIQEVLNSYEMDLAAQQLLTSLAVSSPDTNRYSLEHGLIKYHSHLWIGANLALQTKLISNFHATPIEGHSGILATYHRVKKLFYWSGLKQGVEDFVKQCQICQQAKHEHTHPAGTLQPLPIPEGAWQDLSMDFIEGLPKSETYDVILVIVDRLTKYAHFLPLRHLFTATQVAQSFLDNVVKLHGVPKSIVSDRDKVFTSNFWQALFQAVGTKLNYSTAYHPQYCISSTIGWPDGAGKPMCGNVSSLCRPQLSQEMEGMVINGQILVQFEFSFCTRMFSV